MLGRTALMALLILVPTAGQAQTESIPPWHWNPDAGESGVEITMVFISMAGLGVNTDSGFGRTVREIKAKLFDLATRSGRRFSAVGVAIDWSPEIAVDYLLTGGSEAYPRFPRQEFGPWSAIHAGRGWLNEVSLAQLFRSDIEDTGGIPAATIPQIIVLERSIKRLASGYEVADERVVQRLIGPRAMEDWLEGGELPPPTQPGSTPDSDAP